MPRLIYNGTEYAISDFDADGLLTATTAINDGIRTAHWFQTTVNGEFHSLWIGPGVALTVIGAR